MSPRLCFRPLLAFAWGLALGLLAGCGTAPQVAPSAPARARVSTWSAGATDISERLEIVARRHEIPGMVAVVLRGDRVVAAGATGVRKRGADVAVTLDDPFEIASAAKAMSATVAARLIEQKKLSWDTPVADLFRRGQPAIDPAWQRVTVRQLLEHQAGLKDHLFLFGRTVLGSDRGEAELRREYALKILARPPDFAPGSRFLYNSTDYIILGAALEELTSRTWEELMRDELFRPLGMASAGFGPPGRSSELGTPWGHGNWRLWQIPLFVGDTSFAPGSTEADFPLAAAPAGFVHVTLRDWMKFATLHLRADSANPHRTVALLQAETFDVLHAPEKTGAPYAAGWYSGTRPWARGPQPADRGRVLYHEGNNGRWTSVAWLAPEIDFAVLIVCNRGDMSAGVDEVAGALVGAFAKEPATVAAL